MKSDIETGKQHFQNRAVDANGKFAKGNRSGGRPKGSKIELTVTVKDMILGELDQLGSEHLHQWALENPTEFYRVTARLSRLKQPLAQQGPQTSPQSHIDLMY